MKNKIIIIFFVVLFLSGCAGVGSKGIFGTGVSVAFDPRSVGTQVDDSIMHKNLSTRIILKDKKYGFLIIARAQAYREKFSILDAQVNKAFEKIQKIIN